MRQTTLRSLLAAILACAAGATHADVRMAAIFKPHMVLQRDLPIPIWGWAEPGEAVTVTVAEQTKGAMAGKNGAWRVALAPMPAGGPHTLTAKGNNAVTCDDVLIGDVWLCSGQSNMAMNVRGSNNAAEEAKAAAYPQIRMATLPRQAAQTPQKDCALRAWNVCSPETVPGFSATAYFFGRHLHKRLNVPIGLINASWGGTCVEAWTPVEALEAIPSGRELIEQYRRKAEAYDADAAEAAYKRRLEGWEKRRKAAKEAGKRPPRKPRPARLYNAMIAPLVPYAIRGAIWYQGERNSNGIKDAYDYRFELPAKITSWRKIWGQGDFPYLFVQLPNYGGKDPDALALNRESMLVTMQTTPNTAMAITIDVGDTKDIHPKNKQAVGERLGIAARHIAYGEEICPVGPIFVSKKPRGNSMVLAFDHVAHGLEARDGDVREFTIAGEDRVFVPATATIATTNTITVSNPKVAKPVAVRYAWTNDPKCNLYNDNGLPASPFRTDNWEIPGQEGN